MELFLEENRMFRRYPVGFLHPGLYHGKGWVVPWKRLGDGLLNITQRVDRDTRTILCKKKYLRWMTVPQTCKRHDETVERKFKILLTWSARSPHHWKKKDDCRFLSNTTKIRFGSKTGALCCPTLSLFISRLWKKRNPLGASEFALNVLVKTVQFPILSNSNGHSSLVLV